MKDGIKNVIQKLSSIDSESGKSLKTLTYIIGAGVACIEVIFFLHYYVVLPKTNLLATIFPNVLIEETNENRTNNKENILKENALLSQAARMKAEDMAQKGYFSHISPEGIDPWFWIKQVGYSYEYAGENLAMDFSDSQDVIDAWMESPLHRENILGENFTEIGIGVAKGVYEGKETIFIVQLFGKQAGKTHVSETKDILATKPHATVQAKTNVLGAMSESSVVEDAPIKNVQDRSVTSPEKATTIEKIIVQPKRTMQYIYFVYIGIVICIMGIIIYNNKKTFFLRSTLYGVSVIVLIVLCMMVSQYIGLSTTVIQ